MKHKTKKIDGNLKL